MILAAAAFMLVSQTTAPDYASTWKSIRSAIEGRYYARQQQHDRMVSLLNKYEPKATGAKSQADFSKAVNDMIADFGDSHFGFFTKSDQGYYMMDSLVRGKNGTVMPHIGAWFKPSGDGYTIQMLINGGPAEDAGLRKGDTITRIDGQPFTPVDSFQGKSGTVRLDYLRNGKTMQASLEPTKSNGADFFLDGTRQSIRTIDANGKKYGYVHLWTMSSEDQKNVLAGAVYGRLKDTDGFILDIRDGFGGRPEGYGDPFFRPDLTLSWQMSPTMETKQLFGYGRPLIVLINKGSRSAKEVFAYIMKHSHRAILVGERTGGNVLGTSPSPVGDWGYLEIPMVDVKANGERLEKVGVEPDVALPREYDDNGKDLYIEEAIKQLSKMTSRKAAA